MNRSVRHNPRIWPAAMLDHPSWTGDGRAWVVMCPCRYYRPVATGDTLADVEAAAEAHVRGAGRETRHPDSP
jgi:hypothetical protein